MDPRRRLSVLISTKNSIRHKKIADTRKGSGTIKVLTPEKALASEKVLTRKGSSTRKDSDTRKVLTPGKR
jgi:hypothetical protein